MHDEQRFIWDLAPIGLAKVERGGKFYAVNPRFCEITGYAESELTKRTFQDITHPDDVLADSTEAANLAGGDSNSYQMVKRYISKDGRTVWVSLYVHAIRDAGGAFQHFIVFAIELLNIHPRNGDSASQGRAGNTGPVTLWQYIKANPREAMMVGGGILAVAQGRNIMEILELLWKK